MHVNCVCGGGAGCRGTRKTNVNTLDYNCVHLDFIRILGWVLGQEEEANSK